MKSLLAIAAISLFSIFSNNNETNNLILDELDVKMVNLDYESELESVDFELYQSFYLQKTNCDINKNIVDIKLENIDLSIPNYKYIEELESVEFNL